MLLIKSPEVGKTQKCKNSTQMKDIFGFASSGSFRSVIFWYLVQQKKLNGCKQKNLPRNWILGVETPPEQFYLCVDSPQKSKNVLHLERGFSNLGWKYSLFKLFQLD